jgi:hypothetical protein
MQMREHRLIQWFVRAQEVKRRIAAGSEVPNESVSLDVN